MGQRLIKVTHFREDCIGCGLCVTEAPEFWSMDDNDGKSVLLNSVLKNNVFIAQIPASAVEENLAAVDGCPVGIIQVHGQK